MVFICGMCQYNIFYIPSYTIEPDLSSVPLAESGYAPLNTSEFIRYLNPQVVLLSVAKADKTGLPSPETTQSLEGYNLVRTDRKGWIEISTDGKQMWLEVEKR